MEFSSDVIECIFDVTLVDLLVIIELLLVFIVDVKLIVLWLLIVLILFPVSRVCTSVDGLCVVRISVLWLVLKVTKSVSWLIFDPCVRISGSAVIWSEVGIGFCVVISEINVSSVLCMSVEVSLCSVVNSDVVVDVLSSVAEVAVLECVLLGVGLADPVIQINPLWNNNLFHKIRYER